MESVTVSTELLYAQRKPLARVKSGYELDFWREVRRRWLVFGVLAAVMAAVLAPRVGASGGPLHTEYARYLPLTYILYRAGGRPPSRPAPRLLAVGVWHAHVLAPALCATTVRAFRDSGIDSRVVKGAVLSSAGAGCGWASLALAPGGGPAPALVAANYLSSLVATPLLMLLLCGRATVPPLGGVLATVLSSAAPFALGLLRPRAGHNSDAAPKYAALLLLYVECCDLLREAEGSLYVGDVLVTLMLGWETSTACIGAGLSRLPAVFLAPTQALFLAAMMADDDDDKSHCDNDDNDDDKLVVVKHENYVGS